jgi:hypothetical protein
VNVLEFLDFRVKTDEIRPADGASLGDDAAMLYFKAAATDTAVRGLALLKGAPHRPRHRVRGRLHRELRDARDGRGRAEARRPLP